MRRFTLLALAGLTLATPGLADPLDRSRVPASARWLVHFDIEAALRSKLVGSFLENPEFRAELDEGLAEIRQRTGLDPMKDLYSITMFGEVQDPERGVLLLSTSSAAEGALSLLPELSEGEVEVSLGLVDGFEVTGIGEPGGKDRMFVHPVRSADGLRTTFVAASDTTELGRAIRTVHGQGTSLAAATQPSIAARPTAGSFFFAATADGLSQLEGIKPASQVARLAQQIVFDVGEQRNSLVGNLSLTAATKEDANNMASVLQGGIALLNLAASDEPEAEPFLDLLSQLGFQTVDRTVSVSFAYEVDTILRLIEEVAGHGQVVYEVDADGDDEVILRTDKRYEFEY